jgi:Protein of unknown function (DUF3108)
MKGWIAGLVLALGLASASGAAAQTAQNRTYQATYSVSVAGFTGGELNLDVRINGANYTGTLRQRATGLMRTAVGDAQDYDASARGVITPNAIRPTTYTHTGGSRDRTVTVTFSDTDVVTVANPPLNMGNPPATRQQRIGSTDQISSFVDMMVSPGVTDPCNRTIRVYDGRARFDLVMRPNGTREVNNRAFRGTAQRCTVTYRAIAGLTDDPPRGDNMTFLFGRLSNGLWAPLRIEWPTDDAGMAVIQARRITAT